MDTNANPGLVAHGKGVIQCPEARELERLFIFCGWVNASSVGACPRSAAPD
jgi:hypothetical protein